MHKRDVKTEEPARLLLDPCVDEPVEFLTFDDRGLIYRRVDAAGKVQEKGKVSIDVYALQPKGLVEARLRVINDVIFQFEQLRIAAVELSTLKEEGAADARIEGKRDQIARSGCTWPRALHPMRRISAWSDYIRRTKAAGGFDDLIRAGIDPEIFLT